MSNKEQGMSKASYGVWVRRLAIPCSLLAIGYLVALAGCGSNDQSAETPLSTVARGSLTIKANARGELRAVKSRKIVVPRFGRRWSNLKIIKLVSEGTNVKQGDFLASLDKADLLKNLRRAKADLVMARADMARARKVATIERSKLEAVFEKSRADLEHNEIDLTNLRDLPGSISAVEAQVDLEKASQAERYANAEYEPVRALADEGIESQSKSDEKKLERDIAEVGKQIKRVEYEQVIAGALAVDIRQAELDIEEARVLLAKAEAELEHRSRQFELDIERSEAETQRRELDVRRMEEAVEKVDFYAPSDGVVAYARVFQGQALEKIKEGITVRSRSELMTIEDTSAMIAEIQIEESRIAEIGVGQRATITLDAIVGETFTGVVTEIGKIAKEKGEGDPNDWWQGRKEPSGVRVFDIKIRLDEADERFRPMLSGDVDVIIEERNDVLTVPLAAVFRGGDALIVYVWRRGKAQARQVVVGKASDGRAVIEEGLSEGERICLEEPETAARLLSAARRQGP